MPIIDGVKKKTRRFPKLAAKRDPGAPQIRNGAPGHQERESGKCDNLGDPDFGSYPLSHRISFKMQEKMQRARDNLRSRLGDVGFSPENFQVVQIPLTVPGLDSAFEGYRLVQISDIHFGQWITSERLEGVVDLVNSQNPDLVAITGDFFSYVLDKHESDLARILGRIRARDATVAVLGNHDHWLGANAVRRIIRKGNILELANDVFSARRGDAALHIAGLDDVLANKQDLERVLQRLPDSGPAVLLVHEPDFADKSSGTGRFCLQLSGHSHGGQIVIPGYGTPIRGYHFKKYPLGRYQVGEMVQYTNRGLGTNLFWSRINCPPEITTFTFHASPRQASLI